MYNKIVSENKEWIDGVWEKIDKKMKTVSELSKDKIPYTTVNGVHNNMAKDDVSWWTNGFWSGFMWLLYVGTGDERYRAVAETAENLLDAALEDYDGLHHDVGFMWHISAGVNYRLFGGKKSRLRATYAANILASRYNPDGRFIRSWNGDNRGWVIIDSMMNIPLLYWASEEYDDNRFKAVALSHAETVMKNHVRADATVHHIVKLDEETGEFVEAFGGQGCGLGSAWTRGQAWAVYGFILSYIHTGRQEFLDTAKRVANMFIANASANDWVIPIDFRQPEEPRLIDTTAAAIAACGMIEIAKSVGENEKKLYLKSAIRLLKTLDERFCDYGLEEQSILQMGSEAYRLEQPEKIHIPIIYGDYFFTEAIYKLKGFDMLFW
ncbi:MAG: glycoside hydrolase family 88 protein [Oscillospiraceae bacterium]|nr:glycoside hydrolase family 88 protein [Oscillospiraceae bacterium]